MPSTRAGRALTRSSRPPAGPSAATAEIHNSTIRNSIVKASGTNGRALTTSSDGGTVGGTYRNVTAIASGAGGIPIEAYG